MTSRTVLKLMAWAFGIMGLLGVLASALSSSLDRVSPYPGIALLALCLAAVATLNKPPR